MAQACNPEMQNRGSHMCHTRPVNGNQLHPQHHAQASSQPIVLPAHGCDMLQGIKYTEQHDKVCTYLHWCILQDMQQPAVTPNQRQHKAVETPSIYLEEGCTLMYNMTQCMCHAIATNCPNIILLDEKKRTALLSNVPCPMDMNMVIVDAEKHKKYCNLKIAMKKQYQLRKIQTVPIVMGALGTLC
eukprot:9527525-Ditylum_brightwellii.AAC.1